MNERAKEYNMYGIGFHNFPYPKDSHFFLSLFCSNLNLFPSLSFQHYPLCSETLTTIGSSSVQYKRFEQFLIELSRYSFFCEIKQLLQKINSSERLLICINRNVSLCVLITQSKSRE